MPQQSLPHGHPVKEPGCLLQFVAEFEPVYSGGNLGGSLVFLDKAASRANVIGELHWHLRRESRHNKFAYGQGGIKCS